MFLITTPATWRGSIPLRRRDRRAGYPKGHALRVRDVRGQSNRRLKFLGDLQDSLAIAVGRWPASRGSGRISTLTSYRK